MADLGSFPSPKEKYRRPTSSFLGSPRLFTSMVFSETEAVMSPTSILDSKPFSGLRNPFWSEVSTPKTPESHDHKRLWDKLDSKGIVDALTDDQSDPKLPKPESRMVLFGSMLKIQIPTLLVSPAESPKSPPDFGVKTGNSQSPLKKHPFGSLNSGIETPNSPGVFTGCLSVSEMELSEDYTCVITHGPNPRTTHIFDNCIIESCCGVVGFSASKKENGIFSDRSSSSPPSTFPSESFLSFCHTCKKHLGQGEDIYMYRGEKAFCSVECRYQEMLLEEEGADGLDIDDVYGSCSL